MPPTPPVFPNPTITSSVLRNQSQINSVEERPPLSNQPTSSSASGKPDRALHPFGTDRFLSLFSSAKNKSIGDRKVAQQFGKRVIVFSDPSANVYKSNNPGSLPQPGNDAMALLNKFWGAADVLLISSHRSPHLLEYLPRPIAPNFTYSESLSKDMKADSAFFLNTSREGLQELAGNIPRSACVVISNNAMQSVAEQVALLNHMRPDLKVFGHASTFSDPKNMKGAVEAFRRVSAVLGGEKKLVVCSLKEEDCRWIQEITGVNIPTGTAIPALFDNAGKLDRESFQKDFEFNTDRPKLPIDLGPKAEGKENRPQDRKNEKKDGTKTPETRDIVGDLNSFADIYTALNLSAVTQTTFPEETTGKIDNLRVQVTSRNASLLDKIGNRQDPLKKLGKVLILGSTGNVGDGILRALSGRVDIDAPVRDPGRAPDSTHLGNSKHPLRQLSLKEYSKKDFTADTVFITAAAPRNKGVTDRAGQLAPNLNQVMIPLMAKIPADVKLVQIITNPCADMTYAAWLLRPDLAGRLSSHSGTDTVRQQEHVPDPQNPDTYFTFGPHSPKQVNVDFANNRIDPSIANKASDINRRSGGQATTDPTSLSSIFEALNIVDGKQSSYAFPLKAEEASQLQRFLRESGDMLKDIEVHEGLAPTLPRKNGKINWAMLEKARKVPGFLEKAEAAIKELAQGRNTVLELIVNKLKTEYPERAGEINDAWVFSNRDKLLEMLDTDSRGKQATPNQ